MKGPVVPRSVRKKEKLKQWEVLRIKASPAALIGLVEAPDEQTALKVAIEQFRVRPVDQWRLIVRPH